MIATPWDRREVLKTMSAAGELLVRPAQAMHRVEPRAHQVAHRLVPGIGHPHHRQLARPVQLGQAGGVPPALSR
jgi:hypothetical protein